MNAELPARRTAAAAVVTDFRAELSRHPLTRPPDGSWAHRLAAEVTSLLDELDRLTLAAPTTTGAVLGGGAYLTGDDVRTVLDVLDAAADCKRARAAICPEDDAHPKEPCTTCVWRLHVADEYDALARRIGDTQ